MTYTVMGLRMRYASDYDLEATEIEDKGVYFVEGVSNADEAIKVCERKVGYGFFVCVATCEGKVEGLVADYFETIQAY
jgi:hypothetical protein